MKKKCLILGCESANTRQAEYFPGPLKRSFGKKKLGKYSYRKENEKKVKYLGIVTVDMGIENSLLKFLTWLGLVCY